MRIAFDLDDTLIPCGHRFPLERPTLLARLLGCEPTRHGARAMLRRLRSAGWEVWAYTTSMRSPGQVRVYFFSYGIWLGGVVNGDRHLRWLRGRKAGLPDCSKYPPAFGIDVLVDDLEGVHEEGRRHGFRVVRVAPDDEAWADKVLAACGC